MVALQFSDHRNRISEQKNLLDYQESITKNKQKPQLNMNLSIYTASGDTTQDAAINFRVKWLYSTVHDFGKVGIVAKLSNSNFD